MGAENSRHHRPPLQHSASLDSSSLQTQQNHQQQQQRRKSQDLHFSDFNFFPDRYDANKKRGSATNSTFLQPAGIMGGNGGSNNSNNNMSLSKSFGADSSGFGGGFLSPGYRPGAQPITKHNFRLRTHSEGATSKPGHQQPGGGKLYYFDYSCLPDKDPKCAQAEEDRKRRVRMASQGEDEEVRGITKSFKAPSPGKKGRVSDYGFFDYSMIPDKMDAGRGHRNTRKTE